MPARKAKTTSARRKARPRRPAEETRREILEAAQRLLTEGGPEAIRLQEIARIVGVSHPAILHHFGSRDGLMSELEDHVTNLLIEDVGRLLLTGRPMEINEASGQDLIQAVAVAMNERGLAPLIAWLAVRQEDEGNESSDVSMLVGRIVELIHYRLTEDRDRSDQLIASHEEIGFAVRLTVVAMFGDALFGENMGQVSRSERTEETRRFRNWLADLVIGQLSRDPTGSPD